MGFKHTFLKVLNVEKNESTRVFMLLGMGFFIGIYFATLSVGASSLFLQAGLDDDLPLAILTSGILGIIFTAVYNFFQNRLKFSTLAISALIVLALILSGIEFAFNNIENPNNAYFFAFTFIMPSNFIILLVFWGSFGRMFNLRQSKRIIGSIDTGQLIASILALFTIPIIINTVISTEDLLFVTLLSTIGILLMFILIVLKGLIGKTTKNTRGISYKGLVKNKYISLMAFFIIISMIVFNFIDYSFLTVTTEQFDDDTLPKFLSLFEATVVIFSFLFQTFVTDKIIAIYGLKVSLLINPMLLALFTAIAVPIGYTFGYSSVSDSFIFFFIIISMSKLFNASLKDALDGPAFKLYFLPIDNSIRFDVQTKIEGVITAFAGLLAGGLMILITNVTVFSLIHISIFVIPAILLWYLITKKMHNSYRDTLQTTLTRNKKNAIGDEQQEYAVNRVLENEVNSNIENKVIYGLKIMEKLEPALFESSILKLQESESKTIKNYALDKIKSLDIEFGKRSDSNLLAKKAVNDAEDFEFIAVSADKLHKLSKSVKSKDRILAAKLLRKLINDENIFILLELLRDIDPAVKKEALITARKINRPETSNILLTYLQSPHYCNAAASALIEAGESVLEQLEAAFHKSGQSDMVMLKIVQIIGRIGGDKSIELLWNKIEYPNRQIVKQILLSFRYFQYQAQEKEINNLTSLLENEIGKSIWNLAALTELPEKDHYKYLREAINEEIDGNYDTIFIILSILYDAQSIQLVRENIESGTSDGIAFAIELLDLFVSNDLKPKLFPLFDDIDISEKISALQIHFPRENYNEIQVLNYLLNKNYNQINRWTKACALHAIAFINKFRISRGLIAQLFNSDKMLQEAAAWVIYHKDENSFKQISERLPLNTRKFLEQSIENNKLHDGLDDGYFLNIEIVMRLRSIPIFENIKGVILCDLADKVKISTIEKGNHLVIDKNEEEDIYMMAIGEADILNDNTIIDSASTGEVLSSIFEISKINSATHFKTNTRAVIFHLSVYDFYNVMANHHELAQSFINNVNKHLVD